MSASRSDQSYAYTWLNEQIDVMKSEYARLRPKGGTHGADLII